MQSETANSDDTRKAIRGADGLACWAVQSPMLKLIGTLHDDQGRSG